jgi:hypothetical protein
MSKRPKIKGRGADIYLGDEAEHRSNLRQGKFKEAPVVATVQAEDKLESPIDRGQSPCALEGLKRALAFHIRNSETLANQAIELQEQSVRWAKETPLAPLFEVQASIARKIVEWAAAAARHLWQIGDQSWNTQAPSTNALVRRDRPNTPRGIRG